MVIRGGYGEYIYPVPVRNSVRYLTADYSVHRELLAKLYQRGPGAGRPAELSAARAPDRHRRTEQRRT